MRRPTRKAILFFFVTLIIGYAVSFGVMAGLLNTELRLYGFFNLSLVAFLIAFTLLVWLDKPLDLKLFQWPEATPEFEEEQPATAKPGADPGTMFPHEVPSEHWQVDFGDPKQVYQGTDLPIWLLAGWAIFIIWAVVYLVSGLPGAFQ